MAPSLNLNIPLEDYGVPLAALLGGGALAIVLRTWRRDRQAGPQAIELEETGTTAGDTTSGADLGGSHLRTIDNAVANGATVDAINIAVAPPLRAVDNAVVGRATVNTIDIAVPTPLRAIVNAVATPFRAIANAIAGGATADAIDTAVPTPFRIFDNAIAMEEGGALANSGAVDASDFAYATD